METAWATDTDFIRNKGTWLDEAGVRVKRDGVPNVLQVPSEISTIMEAIAKARNGDVIAVSPGVYTETLIMHKSVNIRLEIPPFLPIEACRTVTIVGANGEAALRLCPPAPPLATSAQHSEQEPEQAPEIFVSCYDIIFQSDGGTLLDHAIEVEGCRLHLESCEAIGGTHALFAYNHAVIESRASVFRGAARAGVSLASGAQALLQSCKLVDNAEEGLCVCGWTAGHSAGGTAATLETSSVERNAAFGLHVLGGGALRARGCDVRHNGQSGVHVLHRGSACALDTCRISDNGWYGVCAQKLLGEAPADVSLSLCLLRRNLRGAASAPPDRPLRTARCRGLDDPPPADDAAAAADAAADPDAEGDGAAAKEWLEHMGLRGLAPLLRGVGVRTLRDARSLTLTDLQAAGIADLYTRRLLVLRLAVPRRDDDDD
jgi:hypothetical protein